MKKKLDVKVVLGQQPQDQKQRFEIATDLLLADIVRRVMQEQNQEGHEQRETTEQEIHRTAAVQ
jgi:hypothetical protein